MTATLKLTDKADSLRVHFTGLEISDAVNVVLEDERGGLSGYWVSADPTPESDGIKFEGEDFRKSYRVTLAQGVACRCTCPDHKYRGRRCKHMVAAADVSARTF